MAVVVVIVLVVVLGLGLGLGRGRGRGRAWVLGVEIELNKSKVGDEQSRNQRRRGLPLVPYLGTFPWYLTFSVPNYLFRGRHLAVYSCTRGSYR